jgi:hypothetical protein
MIWDCKEHTVRTKVLSFFSVFNMLADINRVCGAHTKAQRGAYT